MSNLTPTNGGWAEYQRLVLAELQRYGELTDKLITHLNKIDTDLALLKQQIEAVAENQTTLRVLAESNKVSITALQQGDAIQQAITRYRNWIVGALFLLITTGIIPLVRLIFGF